MSRGLPVYTERVFLRVTRRQREKLDRIAVATPGGQSAWIRRMIDAYQDPEPAAPVSPTASPLSETARPAEDHLDSAKRELDRLRSLKERKP